MILFTNSDRSKVQKLLFVLVNYVLDHLESLRLKVDFDHFFLGFAFLDVGLRNAEIAFKFVLQC